MRGSVVIPLVSQFLGQNSNLHSQGAEKFLSIESIGRPITPCNVAPGVKRLDENECLYGRIAGLQCMNFQSLEHVRDWQTQFIWLRYS